MSEEALEVVRRIYAGPLSLDPDLLAALADARSSCISSSGSSAMGRLAEPRRVAVRQRARNWHEKRPREQGISIARLDSPL
jgi:hypothetical protein